MYGGPNLRATLGQVEEDLEGFAAQTPHTPGGSSVRSAGRKSGRSRGGGARPALLRTLSTLEDKGRAAGRLQTALTALAEDLQIKPVEDLQLRPVAAGTDSAFGMVFLGA